MMDPNEAKLLALSGYLSVVNHSDTSQSQACVSSYMWQRVDFLLVCYTSNSSKRCGYSDVKC